MLRFLHPNKFWLSPAIVQNSVLPRLRLVSNQPRQYLENARWHLAYESKKKHPAGVYSLTIAIHPNIRDELAWNTRQRFFLHTSSSWNSPRK